MKKFFSILLFLLWATVLQAQQYIPDSSISPAFTRDAEIVPTGETNAICVSNTGTPTPSIQLCATVDLSGKTTYFKPPQVTVATRPANHSIVEVTDGATTSDCTAGGGVAHVLCWWNGTVWTPMGSAGGGSGTISLIVGTSNEVCVTNGGGPGVTLSLCSTLSLINKIVQVGRLDLSGIIAPAQLTSQTDNWNPTGLSTASAIRFTTNAQIGRAHV